MKTALAASFILSAVWKGEPVMNDVGRSVSGLNSKIGDISAYRKIEILCLVHTLGAGVAA